jgi:DNA-binding beta-propeller fold protein YncE
MIATLSRGSWTVLSRLLRAGSCWNGISVLVAAAFLLLSPVCLKAQTAHFGYALSTLGSGFSQPTYAALDASGNLYVTDQGTASVYELTASSAYSTVKTLSTHFGIPTGIAVDANAMSLLLTKASPESMS